MMKKTWKRALSALLTIAMMATLLVVPAAAATGENTYTMADYFNSVFKLGGQAAGNGTSVALQKASKPSWIEFKVTGTSASLSVTATSTGGSNASTFALNKVGEGDALTIVTEVTVPTKSTKAEATDGNVKVTGQNGALTVVTYDSLAVGTYRLTGTDGSRVTNITALSLTETDGVTYCKHENTTTAAGDPVATCTTAGKAGATTCNDCGEVVVEGGADVDKLGHEFGEDGVCTREGCGTTAPTEAVTISFKSSKNADSPYILHVVGNLGNGGLKMESSTDLKFKAPGKGTVAITMSAKGAKIKIGGSNVTADAASDTVEKAVNANDVVELTKDDTISVISIKWTPEGGGEETKAVDTAVAALKALTGVTVDEATGAISFDGGEVTATALGGDLKEIVKAALEAKVGEGITVAVKSAVKQTADPEQASIMAAGDETKIDYKAALTATSDNSTADITGTVTVTEAGGETPPEEKYIAAGNYNFRVNKALADMTDNDKAAYNADGLTWNGLNYDDNANHNAHGPNGSGSLTVSVPAGQYATLTLETCCYGAGGSVTGADTSTVTAVEDAQNNKSNETVTIYNATGDVVINFGSSAYVHSLGVALADTQTPVFAITVADAANGTVTVSPSGSVPDGTEITVTATPADGYKLATLTAGEDNIKEDGKFTAIAATTVTATFEKDLTPAVKLSTTFVEVDSKSSTGTVATVTLENPPEGKDITWSTETTAEAVATAKVDPDGNVTVVAGNDGEATITVKATVDGQTYSATFDVAIWTSPANSWDFKSNAFAKAVEGNATNTVSWRGLTIGEANKAANSSHGLNGYGANTITVPVGAGRNTITVTPSYAGGEIYLVSTDKKTPVADQAIEFIYDAATAGTATLNTGANTYIGSISVATVAKTDLSDKTVTVTVKRGGTTLTDDDVRVGDVLTASVEDVAAADLDFIWTVGGTEVTTNKTATYTVAVADKDKAIKVKAQAKEGSALYENATTEETITSKVRGKVMTVTVTPNKVERPYNGAYVTAADIKVDAKDGNETLTDITVGYLAGDAANDGYGAFPVIKNVADSKNVSVKVSKAGYEDAYVDLPVTITKATPTITVKANQTDDILAEGGKVTFTATGVPTDSSTVLTGHCTQAAEGVTITFAMKDGKLQGVSNVAPNEESTAKSHVVSFKWLGDDNYNAATIENVTLTQVAKGAVGSKPATSLDVSQKFAGKGVVATASEEQTTVSIAVDEAKILDAYNKDKTAFQGPGVQHGSNAYIQVTFDAPEGFDKGTWTVKQTVTTNNVVGTPSANWGFGENNKNGNELDCYPKAGEEGGYSIGDWFGVLTDVETTPGMPEAATYKMKYEFFDGENQLKAIRIYTVERSVVEAVTVTLTANADLADVTVPAKISPAENFELTLAVKDGVDKVLPDEITVTKGGTTMLANSYNWNKNTGKLTITADKLAGAKALVVTVTPANPSYAVTYVAKAGTETLTGVTGMPTNGDVVKGGKVNLPTALTKDGYTFEKWTLNGTEVAGEQTITADTEFVAVFKKNEVQQAAKVLFAGSLGTANDTDALTDAEKTTLTTAGFTPNSDVTKRTQEGAAGANVKSLELKKNGAGTLKFTVAAGDTVTIFASSGNGSTSGTYKLVNGSDTKTGDVGVSTAPTNVVLTDLAAGEWTLSSGSSAQPLRVYALTVENGESKATEHAVAIAGANFATGSGSPAAKDAQITIDVVEKTGEAFVEWATSDTLTLDAAQKAARSLTFTMPDSNVYVSAKMGYAITGAVTPADSGTVKFQKAGTDVTAAMQNDEVTVVATPAGGYKVAKIEAAETATPDNSVTVTDGKFSMPNKGVTVTVTFEPDGGEVNPPATEYNVTVTAGPNGTATADKAKAAEGDKVTLTITPADGYEVDQITAPDGVTVADNKFTMPEADVTINVTFKEAEGGEPEQPTKPDTKDLDEAIKAAEAAIKAANVKTPETALKGEKYVTAENVADYQAAVDAAKEALAAIDENSTAADVKDAVDTLAAATKTFEDAVKTDGTALIEDKDAQKTALTEAKEAAEAALEAVKDVTVKPAGTKPANVTEDQKFITEDVKKALEAKVAEIEAMLEKLNNAETPDEDMPKADAVTALVVDTKQDAKDLPGKVQVGTYVPPRRGGGGSSASVSNNATVTLPDGSKQTVSVPSNGKVTVNVPNATTGTVAIIVDKNGNETVVRDSIVVDGKMDLELAAGDTVKIVNNAKSFVDVPGHWAENEVNFVTARELFNGVDDTHFRPDGVMSRGMMATVLFRLNGEKNADKVASFVDVDANQWYSDGINWANEAGVITGYTDGTFAPKKSISRQELVLMVYRYAGTPAVDAKATLADFTDADSVADWAKQAMLWAVENGIIQGKGNNDLDPQGNATRAEVSAVLQRYLLLSK